MLLLPTIRPMAYAAGGPITLSERSCMYEEMREKILEIGEGEGGRKREREREGGKDGEREGERERERDEGRSRERNIQDERCSSFPSSSLIWKWLPLSQDHCH